MFWCHSYAVVREYELSVAVGDADCCCTDSVGQRIVNKVAEYAVYD